MKFLVFFLFNKLSLSSKSPERSLFKLGNNEISKLEIPTGNPLLIELDKSSEVKHCEYLDIERSKDLLVF